MDASCIDSFSRGGPWYAFRFFPRSALIVYRWSRTPFPGPSLNGFETRSSKLQNNVPQANAAHVLDASCRPGYQRGAAFPGSLTEGTPFMSIDSRLSVLLDRWQQSQEQGQPIARRGNCAEIAPNCGSEVERRIALLLKGMACLSDDTDQTQVGQAKEEEPLATNPPKPGDALWPLTLPHIEASDHMPAVPGLRHRGRSGQRRLGRRLPCAAEAPQPHRGPEDDPRGWARQPRGEGAFPQ